MVRIFPGSWDSVASLSFAHAVDFTYNRKGAETPFLLLLTCWKQIDSFRLQVLVYPQT